MFYLRAGKAGAPETYLIMKPDDASSTSSSRLPASELTHSIPPPLLFCFPLLPVLPFSSSRALQTLMDYFYPLF